MGTEIAVGNSLLGTVRTCSIGRNPRIFFQIQPVSFRLRILRNECSIKCSGEANVTLRTCKNCKTQYDPSVNHPRACRHHTAHFGGETRRKFESVYSGGTMNTPDGGKVSQYWHCCGSEDPFDPGCTAAPHLSYDDIHLPHT